VLLGGPGAHVETDLGDELEGSVGSDAGKFGEIDAPAQREQRRTDLEVRLIGAAALGPSGLGQERVGGLAGRLEGPDAGLDLLVAAEDLLLVEIIEFDRLAEHEEEFIAVVPRQGCSDLLFGGLAAGMPVAGQHAGIGLSGDDVPQDGDSRDPGDIADHVVEL
jgi:hypothetical protein